MRGATAAALGANGKEVLALMRSSLLVRWEEGGWVGGGGEGEGWREFVIVVTDEVGVMVVRVVEKGRERRKPWPTTWHA
jgi:hypothetical protein